MLIVTTELIPGRTIKSVIGEVIGVTARQNNAFLEGLRRVDGRPATAQAPSLLRWRWDAIGGMAEEAMRLGADAVIGMKFDNRQINASWSEICAYGTAVRLAD